MKTVLLLIGCIVASIHIAQAQQPGKVPRIGFLDPGTRSSSSVRILAFQEGLRELGYTEGKNIFIEYRFGEGKLDPLGELAAELVRLKVDIIVARTAPAVQAVKTATLTIPIVMAGVGDAIGSRFVISLSRPSRNITGVTNITHELAGKRLELLKEAAPKVVRVAALYGPANPPNVLERANKVIK